MTNRIYGIAALFLSVSPTLSYAQIVDGRGNLPESTLPSNYGKPVPDIENPIIAPTPLKGSQGHDIFHIPSSDEVSTARRRGSASKSVDRTSIASVDPNPFPVDPNDRPYWNIGLFSSSGGTCTGAYVGKDDLIMTADHCVRDPQGNVFKNFKFIQSAGGKTHKKEFQGTWCLFDPPDGYRIRKYDYVFFKSKDRSSAGYLGLNNTPPANTYIQQVGYPSEYGGGKKPWGFNAPLKYSDGYDNPGIASPFKGGSSGGPWIRNPATGGGEGTNISVSLTSGVCSLGVCGPLYDAVTWDLYNKAYHCALPSSRSPSSPRRKRSRHMG